MVTHCYQAALIKKRRLTGLREMHEEIGTNKAELCANTLNGYLTAFAKM